MKTKSRFGGVVLCATITICALPGPASAKKIINLDRTADQFTNEVNDHLAGARVLLKKVLAVKGKRNVENTLSVMNDMYIHLDTASQMSELFAQVHPIEAVRKSADLGQQQVSTFITELNLNRDLYDACKAVDMTGADKDAKRLMFKTLREFRRAGVDRDEATRERVTKLQQEMVILSQKFSNNWRDDVRNIKLDSPADLDGLPDDFIKSHPPGDDGKITITTDYPDSKPFMKYARNADARKRLYGVYHQRGYPANIAVLDELLAKRHELATLLGYANWADYITEDKMIKNASAVDEFIKRITKMAKGPADADMAMLLRAKRSEHPSAKAIKDYEKTFYEERVKADKFNFDSQEARSYFEFNRVQQGLFDVTGKLFGVQFRPVTNVKLWHKDVTAWDLYDGKEHIGRFMLDLHPRKGKYKHAACFGYQTGINGKQIPINVLVCNFPNPRTTDGPALMEHGQVDTFFHEFGHLLHALFAGHHDWIGISGISTEWDFVEAPSQMLQEWVWDADTLQMFATHHETGKPIPTEMVTRMRGAKEFGKGLWVQQQMFYAAISLNYHNRDPKTFDTTGMLKELTAKYAPCGYVPDTYRQCSFGHLTGYSAIYYTYMWSMVIAKDMFSEFEKTSMFDHEVAKRYRQRVLEPGGADEAANLVRDFLGRPYGFKAYGKWLATKPSPAS
jgi:Zn-dependent oligopeptidase